MYSTLQKEKINLNFVGLKIMAELSENYFQGQTSNFPANGDQVPGFLKNDGQMPSFPMSGGEGMPDFMKKGEGMPDFMKSGEGMPDFMKNGEGMPDFMKNGGQANGAEVQKFEIPIATQQELVLTDYIKESLEKVAYNEGFRNFELSIDHGSSIGDGFVGILMKATIRERNEKKILTVLAKIPPSNKARRDAMKSMMLFEREVFMYNVFLPEMVEFQKKMNISKEKGFFNFPKIYFAEYDREKDDAIIVMEDLRESGSNMWNKFKPINFEHTKLVIAALGRLHALSFAMKAKRPEQFEKFKKLNDMFSQMGEDDNFEQYINGLITNAVNTIDPSETKMRKRAIKLLEGFKKLITESVDPEAAEPFSVVTHGDTWSNNFMFHYNKRGVPDGITLIDWQISRYCSPILDFVYFTFICTDRELRAKHFDEMISIYHRSLKELLDHMGGDVASQFPFTSLLRQLKKFGKFGVITAIFILPTIQSKKEDLPDMDFIAEKMKNGEMDPVFQEEMMKKFQEQLNTTNPRIRDVMVDAIKYGYL